MQVFFVNAKLAKRHVDHLAISGDEVVGLLNDRAIADGMPVYLDDETMMPVEPLCSWGRSLSDGELAEGTMKDYGRMIARLADFQFGRGRDLLSATESDLQAYKKVRTQLQKRAVSERTWDKEAQLIDQFYGHLVDRGVLQSRPRRMVVRGRRLKQKIDIRHLTFGQYRYFRDVGLGGQLPDSSVNRSFRGWAPHRNRAAADLALGTGMRWREWATVLLPELGIGVGHRVDEVTFTVQACAKYGKARTIYVPQDAMRSLGPYLMLERPELAAQRAESAETAPGSVRRLPGRPRVRPGARHARRGPTGVRDVRNGRRAAANHRR